MKLWEHTSNYAGAVWPATFVFLSRTRDSDDLENSNFDTALARLKSLPPFESEEDEKTSRIAVRENNWAFGWVEWIAIHQDDTAAVALAEEMERKLDDYPVLDEEDWIRREEESAQTVWRDCYSVKDRVDYIRKWGEDSHWFDSFADLMGCVRGKYFYGPASQILGY